MNQLDQLCFVTFKIGDLLLGVNIEQVREIKRHSSVTIVPRSQEIVRGVINLRGNLVTLLDLNVMLGNDPTGETKHTGHVILEASGELIGLVADRIEDVINCHAGQLDELPSNMGHLDCRLFRGVVQLEGRLLVILDGSAILNVDQASSKLEFVS